ncbi:hypothetical protein KKE19_00755 [Patescibacteria group bacterium]|nr:hypothetical protein [Patescibacteria group bacterium]MBU4367566.1 hypothetical protein [Patescibacteria group bacterium]MBU4461607.1 hypothetical protein [Patescibacteria group bacterium]MCG2699504.1 hypothetical protein [Candidatus Parcubacteria bacterium]
MNNVIIKSPWIIGNLSLQPGKTVQISIVVYGHLMGMPARFCAGLVPAIDLSRRLKSHGFGSIIRAMDPTPIVNYCNRWQTEQPQLQFRDVTSKFLHSNGVNFFFDEAEQMRNEALEVLRTLGVELESSVDEKVVDMVQRIKESGRKHGGRAGSNNAVLYMAAHPFSWLDMYHPLIWKRLYSSDGFHFVNLMSKSEERFAVVRRFLRERRPDLCTKNNPVDKYMTVCNTPCYIPIEDEPLFADLSERGYNWCYGRYCDLKVKSKSHERACKDFEVLMLFLKLGGT